MIVFCEWWCYGKCEWQSSVNDEGIANEDDSFLSNADNSHLSMMMLWKMWMIVFCQWLAWHWSWVFCQIWLHGKWEWRSSVNDDGIANKDDNILSKMGWQMRMTVFYHWWWKWGWNVSVKWWHCKWRWQFSVNDGKWGWQISVKNWQMKMVFCQWCHGKWRWLSSGNNDDGMAVLCQWQHGSLLSKMNWKWIW